jgi:acetyl esterase/lipase
MPWIKSALWFKTVLYCVGIGLLGASSASAAQWRAGWDREVITPQEPLWMAGYAARTEPAAGTRHDLWAKALILEDPQGEKVLLISLDLLALDRPVAERIRTRLRREQGWELAQIALACSHTHSGPVTGSSLGPMYALDQQQRRWIDDYTQQLEATVVRIAARALERRQPVEVGWTRSHCEFAVNRRQNAEPQVAELRAAGALAGPVDHDVPILVVRDTEHQVRSLVFGYACHATVLSDQLWSGDWPGFAQLELERRFPNCQAMFVAGCGGDQNPLPRRTEEFAANYGRQMAEAVEAAVEQRVYPVAGRLAADYQTVALPFAHVPSVDELRAEIAAAEDPTRGESNRFAVARAIHLLEQWESTGQIATAYDYPVQTWQVGTGPTWVFLGGEVVVDYALRIKRELGDETTFVSAYANDVMAYIPSERVLAEGGYEGGGAMVYYGLPSAWQAGLEAQICGEVKRQERSVKARRDALLAQAIPALTYDRHRLLYYRDDAGRERPIETAPQWEFRRQAILQGLQALMGPLPDRTVQCPLDVRELGREKLESYTRVALTYAVEPGSRVAAHLYLPDQPRRQPRAPAMLALHQTAERGKWDVGLDGQPDRAYAHELASRGYVVLAPDYPSFGDLADYDFAGDRYVSGTMKGVFNHLRAVDLLSQLPGVDPDHLGVIGHSLGGHNAMFVAAFDLRLKVVVSSCGWTRFDHYYGGKKLENWAQDRYMPWMRTVYRNDPQQVPFDFDELIAALAPRTFFSCSPLNDENFAVAGVQRAEATAREVYALLGANDALIVRYPQAEHSFPAEERAAAYRVIDAVLNP